VTAAGGYILAVIVAVVGFVCWWSADTDLRELKEHVADLKAWRAANFGGPQPVAVTDDPVTEPIEVPTEPMPRLDVAAGVRVAREANRPRPTPFPRASEYGRHAAR
jgi:hypothetical protein